MRTHLTGDESLEAEEILWGLEGAENMGQEGERGEVGLGDGALDRHRQAETVSSWSLAQQVFNQRASLLTWLVCCCALWGSACREEEKKEG